MLLKILRDRRFHRLALIGAVLGVAALLILWKLGVDLAQVKAWWHALEAFLSTRPWWLFAALVILPGLPLPASALMLLAGAVWHDEPLTACGIALGALALNLCWTYAAAAWPARGLVERLLRSRQVKLPSLTGSSQLKLILILRLTPGMPLFIQNYALGFLRVHFGLYLALSMACSGAVTCGVVLTGAGLSDGRLTTVLAGLGLLIVGVLAVQLMRKRVRK